MSAKASQRSKGRTMKSASRKARPKTGSSQRAKTFTELAARATPPIAATAVALRNLVQRALPGLDENIYGGAKTGLALYSRGKSSNVICGIGPGAAHCLLYIHHAEGLDHPALRIEGQGKHCVHIKFADATQINSGALTELLRTAARRAPK